VVRLISSNKEREPSASNVEVSQLLGDCACDINMNAPETGTLVSPLERKYSNDPNGLVSTKLLQSLSADPDEYFEIQEVDNEEQQQSSSLMMEESSPIVMSAIDGMDDCRYHSMDIYDDNQNCKTTNSFMNRRTTAGGITVPKNYSLPALPSSPLGNEEVDQCKVTNRNRQRNNISLQDHPKHPIDNTPFTIAPTSCDRRSWFPECLDSVNQLRYYCGMFVNHPCVQLFIIFLISVNAIMMGLATFDFVKLNPPVNQAFETTDYIFLVIFTIELGLQFLYHGLRLLLDGWLVFDLVIVVTSWSFSSLQIVRTFRIFRALRLVSRVKILRNLILGELVVVAATECTKLKRHATSHDYYYYVFALIGFCSYNWFQLFLVSCHVWPPLV
jgi:Ion transport protein